MRSLYGFGIVYEERCLRGCRWKGEGTALSLDGTIVKRSLPQIVTPQIR